VMHPWTGQIGQSAAPARNAAEDLLVDSAIGRLEKLRRVFELEEWIRGGADDPLLAASCTRWRDERAQLLGELNLEPFAADSDLG
jgi:hypothetical protein